MRWAFRTSPFAQEVYPARPVRIIVPFAAGGVADALPRIVGEKLSQKWGQPVVVENKPGASGNIGMAEGARAAPDGYTLVLAPAGNLTVSPTLFPQLPFDSDADLTPVTLLAHRRTCWSFIRRFRRRISRELDRLRESQSGQAQLRLARRRQRRASRWGASEDRSRHQGDARPYKGIAPAVNDLLGGNVQMMFAGISTVLQHVKAGKLVAIAIASPRRNPQLPDVPTVDESGHPGFDVTSWYGIVAVRAHRPRSCRSCSATWPRLSGARTSRPSSRVWVSSRWAIRPSVRRADQGRKSQVDRHRPQGEHPAATVTSTASSPRRRGPSV